MDPVGGVGFVRRKNGRGTWRVRVFVCGGGGEGRSNPVDRGEVGACSLERLGEREGPRKQTGKPPGLKGICKRRRVWVEYQKEKGGVRVGAAMGGDGSMRGPSG